MILATSVHLYSHISIPGDAQGAYKVFSLSLLYPSCPKVLKAFKE